MFLYSRDFGISSNVIITLCSVDAAHLNSYRSDGTNNQEWRMQTWLVSCVDLSLY